MSDYTKPQVVEPRLMEFSSQLVADHDRQVLYIFPPKCAQTSLRKWACFAHESPVRFDKVPALSHYTIVMSVRNPFHRFVSAWQNKYPNVSFDALLKQAISTQDMALDIHLQAQSYYLDLAGIDVPDFFLRVGPWLADDVAAFTEALSQRGALEGLEQRELTHENKSGATIGPFDQYDNEVLELFKYRYRDDFKLWELANEST